MSHRNDFAVIDADFVFGCHRQWTVHALIEGVPALDVVDLNPFQYGMGYVDSEAISFEKLCNRAGVPPTLVKSSALQRTHGILLQAHSSTATAPTISHFAQITWLSTL